MIFELGGSDGNADGAADVAAMDITGALPVRCGATERAQMESHGMAAPLSVRHGLT